MTHTPAQAVNSPESVPAELVELALELALAVQKRAIYPAGHPMLRGAAGALAARMRRAAERHGVVRFAASPTAILVDDTPVDAANAILRDFAEHLHEHQLATIRVLPGVADAEVEDLLTTLATSARRVDQPLGALGEEALSRWSHIVLHPIDYDSLELSDADIERTDVPPLHGRAAELWADLTRAALEAEARSDASPGELAAAIMRRAGTAGFDRAVLSALQRTTREVGVLSAASAAAMRRRLSEMIMSLTPEVLARLLRVEGDHGLRRRVLQQSLDVLDAQAIVRLIVSGAAASGTTISQSVLRLLSKLARNTGGATRAATTLDAELREQLRRLMQRWTLDDPNPGAYRDVLAQVSDRSAVADAADRGHDDCEPERIVELSLDADQGGDATDRALSRMVATRGLASAFDRLEAYPLTALRERLLNRLASAETLRGQLAAAEPDVRVLHHVVPRLGRTAVEPLLETLESHADAEWIADLLVSIGLDAVAPLSNALPATSTRAQIALLGVFERLEAWPDVPCLRELGMHPDPALRREALRLMLKHEALRDDALLLAVGDTVDRIFAAALATATRGASPRVATALMHRLDEDKRLGRELRGRAVRAVAASRSSEGMRWIITRVLHRHWLTHRMRIRRRTSETVAALAGLAVHWSRSPEAARVLALARRSRDAEIRRAASLPPGGS